MNGRIDCWRILAILKIIGLAVMERPRRRFSLKVLEYSLRGLL